MGQSPADMRTSTFSLLHGAAAVLIAGGQACGGFVGVEVVSKPNTFGLLVCNVFAVFDQPGQDLFLAVGGKPTQPVDIRVIGGTFYQHPLGGDQAPSAALVSAFPSLAYDTFVTIGVKKVGPGGQPEDNLVLTPGWPGFGPSSLTEPPDLGWVVTPNDPQADPFNPNFHAGDGHVLIDQYATADGVGIVGRFRTLVVSSNISTQITMEFSHFIPAPGAVALMGTAGLMRARRRRAAGTVPLPPMAPSPRSGKGEGQSPRGQSLT